MASQSPVDLDTLSTFEGDVRLEILWDRLHVGISHPRPDLKLAVLHSRGLPTILVDGEEYVAIEVHAHAPPEHDLRNGTSSKMFTGEIHIVHEHRPRFPKPAPVYPPPLPPFTPHGSPQRLAVLGVFLTGKPGEGKAVLEQLTDGAADHVFERGEVLPAASDGKWMVRRYAGSLTTPGYDEAVTWFVFEEPLARSPHPDLLDPKGHSREYQPTERRYAIRGSVQKDSPPSP